MGSQAPSGVELSVDPVKVQEHLARLLKADMFRRSATLSHLLEYLVEKAIHQESGQIKESVIALELFHRSPDFDGRLDNIVRVHAHRLRKLLDIWYQTEGSNDELRFFIPKGGYVLRIEPQREMDHPLPVAPAPAPVEEPIQPVATHESVRAAPLAADRFRRGILSGLAVGMALGFCGAVALIWSSGQMVRAKPGRANEESFSRQPLSALWGRVFRTGVNTVASFTNPAFLRTDGPQRLYLSYHGPLNAPNGTQFGLGLANSALEKRLAPLGPFLFSDSWTGTGEALAVHRLTEMAVESGYRFRLVRGRALTYEDVKNSNVIFIGSPWANDMQTRLNIGTTPFQCFGTDKIVVLSPRPGERAEYYPEFNASNNALSASYALFSVLPGSSPGTVTVISAGIDTYATKAAIDFMTSAQGVRDLSVRLVPPDGKTLPHFFQAIIRAEIIRGETAAPSLVAVREVSTPR